MISFKNIPLVLPILGLIITCSSTSSSTMTIRHSNSALPQLTLEKGAGPKKANFKRAGPTLTRAVPGRAAIRKFVNGPGRAYVETGRAGPGQAEKFRSVQGSALHANFKLSFPSSANDL